MSGLEKHDASCIYNYALSLSETYPFEILFLFYDT
jgi:hypothetical protein